METPAHQIGALLDEIQQNLFQRALQLRSDNSREIDTAVEFEEFFTPQETEKPEIHGGFAWSHWAPNKETAKLLAKLKVTVRCIPREADAEPGTCIFSGQPSSQRVVFGKSY